MKAIGSKAEVWHGTARHTSGGLTRPDLMKTKHGRIVSRKQHRAGKEAVKRLYEMGYRPKKGVFKLFSSERKTHKMAERRRTRRVRKGGFDLSGTSLSTNPLSAILSQLKQ